jgi:hypothetical protein
MHGNQLDFHVLGGRIHVTAMREWESRGQQAFELICDLVGNCPELFEGREASVFYGDRPPAPEQVAREWNFCSTILTGDEGAWLPFPCPYALRWPQIGIPDAEALLEEMLADDRDWHSEKIFWIGTDQHPSRPALAGMGKGNPDIMDIELMEWSSADAGSLRSKSRHVPLQEHRAFKYLVDCPGRGYSARLKWLLATGRPVFVVDRDVVEPWHLEMEPWVHFVPVARDLSDLLLHHSRLEADPGLYASLARNGRDFAARRLRVDAQLEHVAGAVAAALRPESGEADHPAQPKA